MKLPNNILKGLLKVFPLLGAAVLSVALLPGCVDDNSLCPEDQPGYSDSDLVWLDLKFSNQGVISQKSLTRSNDDELHEEEASTAAENFVDFKDLEIILFDANGRGVKRFTNEDFILKSIDKTDNSQYTITTKINRAYLTLIGPGKDMTLLAIANSQGTGSGQNIGNDIWMKSTEEVGDMLRTFTFAPTEEWAPNGNDKRIPMAGLLKTKAPTEAQIEAANTLESAFNLTQSQTLELQRSMIKIRVVDQTPYQDMLEYPMRIKSVTLCNGNSKGAIMPAISQLSNWGKGTCVVEFSTKPSPSHSWFDPNLEIKASKLAEKIILDDDPNEYDQFVCYAAEQHTFTPGALKPYLHIVTEEKLTANTTREKSYDVYINDILSDRNLKDMVRNHVYEFQVKASEKSNIEVSYTICPWISMSTNIEFN